MCNQIWDPFIQYSMPAAFQVNNQYNLGELKPEWK